MKIGIRQIVLLAALICSGCQQHVWYKPGVSLEQCQQDLAQAKYDSVKYDNTQSTYNGVGDPIAAGISEGMNSANRRNEIIQAGMEAKGYKLITRDEADKLGLRSSK